jgi:hypothetical protein
MLLIAGLLAACAAAVLALGGDDAAPDRVGLSTHLQYSDEPLRSQLDELRDAGVRWIREDLEWAQIEQEPGRLDWSRTDELMVAAAETGINVLGVLTYSPPWASSAGGDKYAPPEDPAGFAAFAGQVARRYGRGGELWRSRPELQERPLAAVELWNEPWGHFFWKPDPDPSAYARLARSAAEAIRSAGADLDVLVSGDLLQVRTDGSTTPWFEALLRADPQLPRLVDGWTVHPYPSPKDRPPRDESGDPRYRFERVPLTAEVASRHDARRPLWITEIGWSTTEDAEETVSEDEQARYLAEALERALGEWDDLVAHTFVYTWSRSSTDQADREGGYGLRRADGSFKPAWDEIRERLR